MLEVLICVVAQESLKHLGESLQLHKEMWSALCEV